MLEGKRREVTIEQVIHFLCEALIIQESGIESESDEQSCDDDMLIDTDI